LGARIRLARLRRRLRLVDVAERVGVTRFALANVERGKPTTAVAAYLGALWALGLLEHMSEVASPDRDEEGTILERSRTPKTARVSKELDGDF
jgi:transcriptional regulator with XRE-family HTH domain